MDRISPPSTRTQKTASGPRGYPILGVLPSMWHHPLQFFTDAAHRYGDVISLRIGFHRAYLLNHPDHIKHVLQDNHHHYYKSTRVARIKPLFGEGLTTSEGSFWRRQRGLMQPVFQQQRIVALASLITDATAEMLERWQLLAARGQSLDIAAAMLDLTQGIILRALFGHDISSVVRRRIGQSLATALDYINYHVWAVLTLPAYLPTPRHRRFRQALHILDTFVYHLIAERRRTGKTVDDLLSMLLNARDEETGECINDTQLRDEVITLFIAGYTTTTAALTWIWYLLSQHPDVEHTLREELATVLSGRSPTTQDLPALAYTRMVIEEALRLYPPTWMTARTPLAEDEIGGYAIPAKSVLLLSPYVIHRHPVFWENPEKFDPERFTPMQSARRPRFAYFPFGGASLLHRQKFCDDGNAVDPRHGGPNLPATPGTWASRRAGTAGHPATTSRRPDDAAYPPQSKVVATNKESTTDCKWLLLTFYLFELIGNSVPGFFTLNNPSPIFSLIFQSCASEERGFAYMQIRKQSINLRRCNAGQERRRIRSILMHCPTLTHVNNHSAATLPW